MYEVTKSQFTNPQLVLGGPVQTDIVTFASGAKFALGELVIMSTGKMAADAGLDPTKVYGIVASEVDASLADAEGIVYTSGVFNKDEIVFPEGKTYADYKEALRNKGIILK